MRHQIARLAALVAAVAAACGTFATPAFGQAPPVAFGQAPPVRRLSVEEAVHLALEQNLGVRIERLNPQLQDFLVSQARSAWAPLLSSTLSNNRANVPATNVFSGGANVVTTNLSSAVGLSQTLPTGASYAVAWSSARATSTDFFNTYNPQLNSSVSLSVTQPLLKNFKIDDIRHEIESTKKDRNASDLELQAQIVRITRDVETAYWDLTYQIDNLTAQRQGLDLAKQLLSDNERRVQAGTMASLDIVEAQAEVGRNEETVIVAEAAMRQAEDRLRVLVLDPAAPDFWVVSIDPTDSTSFQSRDIDVAAAIRRALSERTDVRLAANAISRDDLDVRYFKNQTLPEVDARAAYTTNAVGGSALTPITTFPIVGPLQRSVVSQQGFPSVLGDVLTSTNPTWSVGVTVAYPLGTSASDVNLAHAKLLAAQGELQRKNIEMLIAADVRDAARQVQTNRQRVDSARASRELAEKRLEVEQKKFTAGIQTSFFVFQAQRDLSQARTNEAQASADYNKSLADFDAVQLAPLGPQTTGGIVASAPGVIRGIAPPTPSGR